MNIPYSYIQILKHLPSYGQQSEKDKAKTKADLEAKRIALEKNSEGELKKLSDAFNLLTNEQAKNQIGLEKLIGLQEGLGKTLVSAAQKSTFLEQRNKELNKSLNVNRGTAADLGDAYDKLGEKFTTGGKQIRKYAIELNSLLPLQAKNLVANKNAAGGITNFGSSLLKTAKYMRENFGMSAEATQGFARFAATAHDGAAGTEEILAQTVGYTAELEKVTGLAGTTQAILSGISNLAADVQLQFRRYPTDLGLAVLKARMLGTSLGEVYSIGKNLLNIEQSVGNELEYQLLSGKRLVNQQGESLTQKFREATLSGDANASADALNEIIESQGDTIKDNFFARKQLAETLGIGEDKLSQMVQQRELLQDAGPEAEAILKLQGEDLATAINKFNVEATDTQKAALKQLVQNEANTMTTDEKMLFQLEALTTAVIGRRVRAYADDGTSGTTRDQVEATSDAMSSTAGLRAAMKIPQNFYVESEEGLANTLSAMGQTGLAFQTVAAQLEEVGKPLPLLANIISSATAKISAATFSGINSISATTVEAINVGSANINANGNQDVAAGTSNDFISRPGGPVQRFSSADTVIGAKSGGPIDQMLASAGGGGGVSIDYNKMASAMAAAMRNVQIVAPTDIYRDSSMNIESIT